MARVLVLADRLPDDSEWKGALTWRIIQALAEGHHEVLAVTTADLKQISLTHPRLTVARPASSWRIDQMPKLARVLFRFQPQIVHVFAPQASRLWPSLEVWPYLAALGKMLPTPRRFSTLFEASDWAATNPSFVWHKQATHVTVFSEQQQNQARQALGRQVQLIPLDLDDAPQQAPVLTHKVLIPAAISEWIDVEGGLQHLAAFLDRHPEASVKIVGGWGNCLQAQRRNGWATLQHVAARITLAEATDYAGLMHELDGVSALWLEPIPRESWKFLLASRLAEHLGKRSILSRAEPLLLQSGSTANSLSRLYSQP